MSNGFPSLMALLKSLGASKKVISVLPIGGGIGITLGPLITTYLMNDDGKCMLCGSYQARSSGTVEDKLFSLEFSQRIRANYPTIVW